jgi:hypothetical protein
MLGHTGWFDDVTCLRKDKAILSIENSYAIAYELVVRLGNAV